jgi:hypothetical protein
MWPQRSQDDPFLTIKFGGVDLAESLRPHGPEDRLPDQQFLRETVTIGNRPKSPNPLGVKSRAIEGGATLAKDLGERLRKGIDRQRGRSLAGPKPRRRSPRRSNMG